MLDLANLSKRERILVYLAYAFVLLLFGAVLYQFVLLPSLNSYFSARNRYNSQQEQNKRALARRDTLLDEYLKLKTQYDEANRLLFTKIQAEDWLEMLPGLSQKTGNIITSITPRDSTSVSGSDKSKVKSNTDNVKIGEKDKLSEEEKKKAAILAGISETPIAVSIKGKYSNIINMFNTLEGFKQLMVISEFNVAKSSKELDLVETTFQLNLIHTNSNTQTLPIDAFPIATQIAKVPDTANSTVTQAQNSSSSSAADKPKSVEKASTKVQYSSKRAVTRSKSINRNGTYSIQIGAFDQQKNSDELAKLMKSKEYDPWIKYETKGKNVPNRVLVGRFKTEEDAEKFGKMMKKELPWVDEYLIKKTK